jgi:hypothetical protein
MRLCTLRSTVGFGRRRPGSVKILTTFTEPFDAIAFFILIGGGNLQKCYRCITLLEPPLRSIYGVTEWFREYAGIFTEPEQAMHKSTLELKLNCLLTAKLLAHNAALFTPTTRQMRDSMVLAFSYPFWLLCGIWFLVVQR